jgi:hypothetical protein
MMAIGALGASKSRVMLVMVQVSSMKTSREASTCFWRLCQTRSVTRFVRTIPLARDAEPVPRATRQLSFGWRTGWYEINRA